MGLCHCSAQSPLSLRSKLDFSTYSAIREEEVKSVEFKSSVVARVVPHNSVAQHFAIVLHVAMQITIWMSTSQLHFNVLFDLACVMRRHLVVHFKTRVFEWVVRQSFWGIQRDPIIPVEFLILS